MKFRVLIFTLFLFFLSPFSVYTQQYLDSLKVVLRSKISNSIKEKRVKNFITNNKSKIPVKELANCYHEYGKWFFLREEKNETYLKKAIFFTEKALRLKLNNNATSKSIKATLYNLGYFYSLQKNYFKAIEYYQQIKEFSDVDLNTLKSLRSLSVNYAKTGDFYKALNNLNTLIDLSSRDTLWREKTLQAYEYRAVVYSDMGRKQFSERIKEDVKRGDSILNLLTKKRTRYHSRLDQIEGNRLLKNGNYKEAIVFFERILKGINPKDSTNIARTQNSLGVLYTGFNDYKKAFLNFDKAILYDRFYSPIYENRGDIYVKEKEYELGLKEYQKAINTLLINERLKVNDAIPQKKLEEVKEKYYLLHHLIQKAKAFVGYYHHDKKKEHLKDALSTFETADKLIDIIRFESTEVQSKLFWREQGASLYLGAVEVCHLLNKPEKALYFMEKNKAILLLEDISNYQAVENAKLPLDLANKEFQLKSKINTLESRLQLVSKKESSMLDTIKRELYLSKRKYASFVDSLVSVYPEYGKYKKRLPVISYKEAIKESKNKNTYFLQYITNDTSGYGLLIGPAESEFFKMEKMDSVPTELKKLQRLVSQKINTKQQKKEYQNIAKVIFDKLIPQKIFQKIKDKEVIIIPDYRLQKISFETLITTNESDSYLIKDATISYAYSISHLKNNNTIKRIAKKGFLAVAPVDFSMLNLPSLHYTLSEVNTTKSIFKGEVLLKEQANKNNFLEKGNAYKGLHLATHAEVGNSEQPWIAFNDEKLSLQEIYGYKNEHELVTLSACKTSLGALQLGEGVMSLARGFFYGGAKSVVSSLWSSNDKTNEKIIVDFYKNLKNGVSKSKALRNAKLSYLKNHDGIDASPFYWGGYILIGDANVVDLSAGFFNWNYVIVGLFVLLIVIVVFFKRKALTNKK